MNKELAKQRRKLNREFWFFYLLGLLSLVSILISLGLALYFKEPHYTLYTFLCVLLVILVRVPTNEAIGKIEYIDKQLSNKLCVIYPILDGFLHREKPRILYVSKNLFRHLPTNELNHQNIHQWYNRHRGRLYNTELIVDHGLSNLQFSKSRTEKTFNKIEDLLEI